VGGTATAAATGGILLAGGVEGLLAIGGVVVVLAVLIDAVVSVCFFSPSLVFSPFAVFLFFTVLSAGLVSSCAIFYHCHPICFVVFM